jgi:hypothetical protein
MTMQNETESSPPKPRLRWYQYRLRTLLIIMTVLAVWMAWISHRARQQKMAVEKVRAFGGTLLYDYQTTPGPLGYRSDFNVLPPAPEWLRGFIGEDYFQKVLYIDLNKTHVNDDDLAILANLPDLEYLNLDQTKITNKGLVYLEGLKHLKILCLGNTPIDDRGLTQLKDLTDLRGLDLEFTNISDAGIINLQRLTTLEEFLSLENTQITDESLKYFKNLKKLKRLYIRFTRVSEKEIANLQNDLPKTIIIFGWTDDLRLR